MGGFGSGRHDYATTSTVEASKSLDVNEFTDSLTPGTRGTYRWYRGGEESGDIVWETTRHADHGVMLRLKFTVTDRRTGEERDYDYPVPIEFTECNFGGERPWFRCPGVVDGEECNRRVGKLYCPPGRDLFLCRHCYDLGYTTSRTSGDEMKQAELRFRKAHAKINGERKHPGQYFLPPKRPKGMHWSTYGDLCEELRDAYREWEEANHAELQVLTQRLHNTRNSQ